MGLQRYIQKRNFRETPEPKGRAHRSKGRALSFVIQKHDATRLHYDFRLEVDGVLKSWAVPKGIPVQKGEKRLAMHVEDHPLEYGGFEGTIPEGNYGAGTVMLWDRGTYEVLGGDPLEALNKGKIHFRLHGKKLEGEWTLVRMRGREEAGKEPWLLIKSGEDIKPISARMDNSSVLSRKTMEQIAEGRGKVWISNQSSSSRSKPMKTQTVAVPKSARQSRVDDTAAIRDDLIATLNRFPKDPAAYVDPMKALLVEKIPRDPRWAFEIKWDGYRAIAVKRNGRVRLFSRRARDITTEFPAVAEAVEELPVSSLVLDGEIVATNEKGNASFQLLQKHKQRPAGGKSGSLSYYVFDILNLENRDLKQLPLERRKNILHALLKDVPAPIRYSVTLDGDPDDLLAQAERNRVEGLIAKRIDSSYEPGRRSGAWVKIKVSLEQEFVIGGYTEPQGTRPYFGALLLGYYEQDKLIFASKVGTGFDTKTLRDLYAKFQKFRTDTCPFANAPSARQGLSRAQMKRSTWLEPKLVCQVRFSEWTDDGGLRQPVFLGLRDDKDAREVVREKPVSNESES